MLKKILIGTLLAGLIGVLITGAVIRTVDRTDRVAEASGRDNLQPADCATERGQGNQDQNNQRTEPRYPNYQDAPEEWVDLTGAVVQTPDDGVDLVIKTDDGGEIVVGTGPGYMREQGFTLQAGELVQVRGYWEDNELKAAQITRMADGATITLRDEIGRPAWSGAGRNQNGGGRGGL